MRLIDADALVSKCGDYYVEEGPEYGFIGTLKCLVDMQPTIGGWTSVKDRMPEKPGRYLAVSDSPAGFPKLIRILMFVKDLHKVDPCNFREKHRPGWVEWDDEYGYYEYDAVTHWMPLPELPKEEKHET